ncbi:unnamed protein product [Clavelina lepadiformis]|uniref:Uncharacterized protein n=1 Tax=Clavelina lepadiformis TaxID=159417 RepID=A0ABP0GGJ5_CLALP
MNLLCSHDLFDTVHIFKTGCLDDPLDLGEKDKTTYSQVGKVGRLLQHSDVLLGQELSDTQGSVDRCVVMVKHPLVLPQISFLLVH